MQVNTNDACCCTAPQPTAYFGLLPATSIFPVAACTSADSASELGEPDLMAYQQPFNPAKVELAPVSAVPTPLPPYTAPGVWSKRHRTLPSN